MYNMLVRSFVLLIRHFEVIRIPWLSLLRSPRHGYSRSCTDRKKGGPECSYAAAVICGSAERGREKGQGKGQGKGKRWEM
jgi:hypothetical protein